MSFITKKTTAIFVVTFLIFSIYILKLNTATSRKTFNPIIAEMILKIDESEIYNTVLKLQNFSTRVYGTQGNIDAGTYLFDRLSNIPGLDVEYQGGDLRNVIATLPGVDETSNAIYIVGAHYDSNSWNISNAPGATDNGGGVAIVLELARVMSQYQFNPTLKFALWNNEEDGLAGSRKFVECSSVNTLNISLYFNYDSACYDPYNRMVLDIRFNRNSQWLSRLMYKHNILYGINLMLTSNVKRHWSDHISFWENGYTAMTTHAETHGPAHTPNDTVDKISTLYAKKNGQLGMSILAMLAEVQHNSL